MLMQFRCPTCEMELRPSNPVSAGSRVRCPNCKTVFTTPEHEEPERHSRGRREPRDDDDRGRPGRWDDDPHRASSRRTDDLFDDYDDRPRNSRRRRDEWDDDYRRRPTRSKAGIPVLVWILGGMGLLLLLACGFGFAVWRLATPQWKDFNSPDGAFTATYPGSPAKKNQVDPNGNMTTLYMVEADRGHIAYSVAFTDLPAPGVGVDPDVVLNAAATAIPTVKSKRPIKIDGHPGLEINGELNRSGVRTDVTNRVFLVGGRMYQVMVVSEKGHNRPADSAKFLESFRLTGVGRPGPW